MKELFSALSEKERTRLRLLGLLFLISLFVLLFFSLSQRRSYFLLVEQVKAREKTAAAAEVRRTQSVTQWEQWEQTAQDIQTLREKFFYREGEEINQLRLDLRKIFTESGISSRSFRYDYASLEKEKIGKISVTFTFTGTYPILKRFLQTLEQYPKFLLLEKIDFLKISDGGTVIDLKIILAGYYANV
jgi:Tfp pilus assembly protein PilO